MKTFKMDRLKSDYMLCGIEDDNLIIVVIIIR